MRSFYHVTKSNILYYYEYFPNKHVLHQYHPCLTRTDLEVGEILKTKALPKLVLLAARRHVWKHHPHCMVPPNPCVYDSIGSLFKPKTKGGRALLKQWMKYPLMDASERLDQSSAMVLSPPGRISTRYRY